MDTFEHKSWSGKSRNQTRKSNSIVQHDRIKQKSKTSCLNDYFLAITFVFAIFLFLHTTHVHHHDGGTDTNNIERIRMKESFQYTSSNGNIVATTATNKQSSTNQHEHRLAGLQCDQFGGPSLDAAQEMVYWEDIPSDESYLSPFHPKVDDRSSGGELQMDQFLTFEPDGGGWNNIRMAMETILVSGGFTVAPALNTNKNDDDFRVHGWQNSHLSIYVAP